MRGSSMSRSPSPSMLTASTVAARKTPGSVQTESARVGSSRSRIITRPASLSTLPDRLDRQLARRAKRDRVDAVLAEPGRDRLAVQGPHPAPPGLLGIVGQLPETRPELALERRRRPLRAVALRDLSLPVQHGSVGRPAAVGEDPAEEQQGLALERVAPCVAEVGRPPRGPGCAPSGRGSGRRAPPAAAGARGRGPGPSGPPDKYLRRPRRRGGAPRGTRGGVRSWSVPRWY